MFTKICEKFYASIFKLICAISLEGWLRDEEG